MRRLVPVILLAACDKPTDLPPPFETPDTPVIEETAAPVETAVDTPEPEPVERDTGAQLVIQQEGSATLTPTTLIGAEAWVVRWQRPSTGALSEPRCIYAWDAKDWLSDPGNRGQANPLANKFSLCPTCAYAFTVSVSNIREEAILPWSDDTDAPGPDAPTLNCQMLRDQGVLPDLASFQLEDWVGYGWDPTYDGDGDETTGVLQIWDSANAVWAPFIYGATLVDGTLAWQQPLATLQVTY